MIPDYKSQIEKYEQLVFQLNKTVRLIAWLRFTSLAVAAYFYFLNSRESDWMHFLTACLGLAAFVFLIRIHFKQKRKLDLAKTFLWLNRSENDFVENGTTYYPDGASFTDINHPFSHDIDLFGPKSLFEYLNRTATVGGATHLKDNLTNIVSKEQLVQRQEAIAELANDLEWRQAFQVLAKLGEDTQEIHSYIQAWGKNSLKMPGLSLVLAFLFPTLGLTSMILLWQTGVALWFNVGIVLFVINMLCFGYLLKDIKTELGKTERIGKSLEAYGEMLTLIESKSWKSTYLQTIQQNISNNHEHASSLLRKAASIYNNMDSVNNGLAVMFLNGTIQFHAHVFSQLVRWKNKNQAHVSLWIEQIGEMESLVSLANFKANNPDYVFPEISSHIAFEELGHPLIPNTKRVNNQISFQNERFVILTGSNMSGKSTFLRTLGIGIVLANAGSVVPAKKAQFYPIHLLASMRLSDSLTESTSYFYSEVKRLKLIMDFLKEREAFVLLDEILRGTNSDDKQSGTIGVLEKLVTYQATGMIATHDLEVCELSNKYPKHLKNQCFEVEIQQDDLVFDYKLRDGICQNKSATFIMKKNDII